MNPPASSGLVLALYTCGYNNTETNLIAYILAWNYSYWLQLPPVLSQHQAGESIFFYRNNEVIHMKMFRNVEISGSQMIEINVLDLASKRWAWLRQNKLEISQGGGHSRRSVDSVFVTYMDINNRIYFVTEKSFKIYCYNTLSNRLTMVEELPIVDCEEFGPLALISMRGKLYVYGITNNEVGCWIYDSRTRMWEKEVVPQSVAEFVIRGRRKYFWVYNGGNRGDYVYDIGDGLDVMLNVQSQSLVCLRDSVPRGYRRMGDASLASMSSGTFSALYVLQKTDLKICPVRRGSKRAYPALFCLWKGMIETDDIDSDHGSTDDDDDGGLVRQYGSPVEGSTTTVCGTDDEDDGEAQFDPSTSAEVGFRMNWRTLFLPLTPDSIVFAADIHS